MNLEEIAQLDAIGVNTSLIASALKGDTPPDAIDGAGRTTALHEVVFSGNTSLVEKLLDKKANIDAQDVKRDTLLYAAVCAGHQTVVSLLLSRKARPNIPNAAGNTPLHAAVNACDTTLIELLLSYGAKINKQNNKGNTPLYEAAYKIFNRSTATIQTLLQWGAYTYPEAKLDQLLKNYWNAPSLYRPADNGKFYTYLLLAGVTPPKDKVFPPPFDTIKANVEATVADWLSPLCLTKNVLSTFMPAVLRALPRLINWMRLVEPRVEKAFGERLFEEAEQDKANQSIFERLDTQGLPAELQASIQKNLTQQTVMELLEDRLMQIYALPQFVAHHLVKEGMAYKELYVDFHRRIFEHNFLISPCTPPLSAESLSLRPLSMS